jgi:hypothetical protein
VAQRLHSEFGYNYDNLKVLLGGWNVWLEKNAADPAGYPIGTGTGGGGGGGGAAAAPTTGQGQPAATTAP